VWKPIVGVCCVAGIIFTFLYDTILDHCVNARGPYVFLRSNQVNGRRGPSTDYPCECVYLRRFLPLKILGEQEEWFFLEDWEGARVWVHRSLCGRRRRYVMVRDRDVPVYRSTSKDSAKRAVLQKDVCVELVRSVSCWLRIRYRFGDKKGMGWIPEDAVWGVG